MYSKNKEGSAEEGPIYFSAAEKYAIDKVTRHLVPYFHLTGPRVGGQVAIFHSMDGLDDRGDMEDSLTNYLTSLSLYFQMCLVLLE